MSKRKLSMRPSVRKAAIYEFVERHGKASVEQLAEKFETSSETVRRDLNALAEAGRVRKVHGGARRISVAEEGLFEERLAQNTQAKHLIAEKLAQRVKSGQSILIDTGSTTLICAQALARIQKVTVFTNSTRIAAVMTSKPNSADVVLLGGSYRHDNAQTVGAATCLEIARFRVNTAILTVGTLNTFGAFDFSEDEAMVARAMIAAAEKLTIVVDHSKLHKRSTYKVCDLHAIDEIILDRAPDTKLGDALTSANVAVW